MPRTTVRGAAGSAPGRVSADFPSIDTIVTAPAAGACPQVWEVHGFLTPIRGTAALATEANLLGTRANGTWANTALTVTLPQPGAYWVAADVDTQICATIPDNGQNVRTTNLWTVARLVNAAGATALLGGRGGAQHQFSVSPGTAFQHCTSGVTNMSGLVNVSAAQGSLTVRIQGGLRGNVQGGSTIQSSTVKTGGRITYVKIGD